MPALNSLGKKILLLIFFLQIPVIPPPAPHFYALYVLTHLPKITSIMMNFVTL